MTHPAVPLPAGRHDPADVALVNALDRWFHEPHIGDNRRAAQAVLEWKKAKGL